METKTVIKFSYRYKKYIIRVEVTGTQLQDIDLDFSNSAT